MTGESDIISDGTQVIQVQNGMPLFPQITGSGCLHGVFCATFMAMAARSEQDMLSACVEACITYTVAGEIATQNHPHMGNSAFNNALLDTLCTISHNDVIQKEKISYLR